MRPTREEILEQLKACIRELGKVPGQAVFLGNSGLNRADVLYYWPRFSALVQEAGFTPNEWTQAIPEDDMWKAMARACLHLRKYPTPYEYRIAARELHLPAYTVYQDRFGRTAEVKARFKRWLENGSEEFRCILDFPGWETLSRASRSSKLSTATNLDQKIRYPFLPDCLQHLDLLARGTKPCEDFPENVNTAFERRCADAFRCLGFDVWGSMFKS